MEYPDPFELDNEAYDVIASNPDCVAALVNMPLKPVVDYRVAEYPDSAYQVYLSASQGTKWVGILIGCKIRGIPIASHHKANGASFEFWKLVNTWNHMGTLAID